MNLKVSKRPAEEITLLIAEWESSGLSKKSFCEEKQINYQTFIGWMINRRKKTTDKKFIPLQVQKSEGPFAELHLGNKKIIFHHPISAEFIRDVLKC